MIQFLKSAFTETQPGKESASFARLASAVIVVFSVVWVSFIVWHKHELPELASLALFNTSIYGMNRASAFFGKKGTDASVQ